MIIYNNSTVKAGQKLCEQKEEEYKAGKGTMKGYRDNHIIAIQDGVVEITKDKEIKVK